MYLKELYNEYLEKFGCTYDLELDKNKSQEEIMADIKACIDLNMNQYDYTYRYDEKEAEESIRTRDFKKLTDCYYKRFKSEYPLNYTDVREKDMLDDVIECLKTGKEKTPIRYINGIVY